MLAREVAKPFPQEAEGLIPHGSLATGSSAERLIADRRCAASLWGWRAH